MATSRCELCVSLTLYDIRVDMKHHNNLADLKNCAESGVCDICLLLWTALVQGCASDDIEDCLRGRLSDPEGCRDTAIILCAQIQDWGLPLRTPQTDSTDADIVWIDVGEIKRKTTAHLNLFGRPNTFAAQHLLGRNSFASPDPEFCTNWTKDWLSYCIRAHPRCGGSKPTPMPTRVIDLGEPSTKVQPKLHITNGQHGLYAALSYSWGEGVRHKVKLKKATMEELKVAIPEISMTLAHQECLQIARKLGFRYVWIDAFGIVQDDKDDWANESVKIADVYGNAHLIIVAGRMDNSLDGFARSAFEPRLPPPSLPYSTFGGKTEEGAAHDDLRIPGWNSKKYYDMSADLVLSQSVTKETVLQRWHQITQAYSLRYVFDPTDNFATISGVALRFQRALGCRFLAGLWENDMIRSLLWKSRRIWPVTHEFRPGPNRPLVRPLGVKGDLKGKPIVRAPSWSWLALLGPIISAIKSREARLFQDPSNIRCHPASLDKETWSPDAWDPKIVKYPFPQCRLITLGCVREVRRSSMTGSQYLQGRKSKWGTSPRTKRELVPLESTRVLLTADDGGGESSQERHVVALGLFDLTDGNPNELSIMCVLGDQGLMLQRQSDGSYCRLGVFIAEDDAWCYDGQHERVVLI
ncbi:heterokaryon incompatibility protein-domain-containing protein [Xylaria castorea]|nr:heterokaryon incompatibility protein-domain-containing protein [Xylaria castorea]